MRILILTCQEQGVAAQHLNKILDANITAQVVGVILSKNSPLTFRKNAIKKIKKIIKIGVLGALNGIRMRKWYMEQTHKYIKAEYLHDICIKHNIPLFTTEHLNSAETKQHFIALNLDIAISLGNGYIASSVFDIPKYGMLNIHHEILPEYQNAQSVIWQIYNNSKTTGYTIHKIAKKIDAGDILSQESIDIIFEEKLSDTVAHTYATLMEKSADGLVHLLQNFQDIYNNAQPQLQSTHYTTPTFWQFLKIYSNFNRLKHLTPFSGGIA